MRPLAKSSQAHYTGSELRDRESVRQPAVLPSSPFSLILPFQSRI
jgi:hypothetical protein